MKTKGYAREGTSYGFHANRETVDWISERWGVTPQTVKVLDLASGAL